ncbi:M23 family metallopeptidase [Deinococcus roseus]|uniref:M23ase beta-sheet core domain-containing protein n=1 Tax=Deinococcus roseus TaxID=392414 RepID=A0ABQ2DHM1_9DEIO|nr:M23 family metallopeptidase [Deinococcus roseus]GGJ56550.1 hypothetical protein GCM10008938_48370 [Deinococcus roseus]
MPKIVHPVKDPKRLKRGLITKFLVDTVYLAQQGTPCYPIGGQGFHTGWDLNGAGGGDSDLGMPVGCISDGVVSEIVRNNGPLWGNIVIVWHPHLDRWSRYAHLKDIQCAVGQELQAGEQLGTIGKGYNGTAFAAHLHLDIIKKKLPTPTYWNGSGSLQILKSNVQTYFENPKVFFARYGLIDFESVSSGCRL